MPKKKQAKERFDHSRGSGTGDGRRFDSIKAQNRPRIHLRLPESTELTDTVEGMVHQSMMSGLNLSEQMKTMLSQDGLYDRDRFRSLILTAMETGDIKSMSALSMLSVFNTMRIRMMEQPRYFDAFAQISPKLAIELADDTSNLLVLDEKMLPANEEITIQFRRLMQKGQILLQERITVEGVKFSVYKVADK